MSISTWWDRPVTDPVGCSSQIALDLKDTSFMMKNSGQIAVGTSGWHYPHWRVTFYPDKLQPACYLEYYLDYFQTVELNNSFYRLPSREMMEMWRDSVPDNFTFAFKANRYITHMKKLRDPEEPLGNLYDRIGLLGEKAGPILFQLPPKWRYNGERFEAFLRALSEEYRYVFEFRDPTWFNEEAYSFLAQYDAAFCIYELAGFMSPLKVTADFVYIRLHGPGGPYQGSYDADALEQWSSKIRTWSKDGFDTYCYFDNDEAGKAPRDANRLKQILATEA